MISQLGAEPDFGSGVPATTAGMMNLRKSLAKIAPLVGVFDDRGHGDDQFLLGEDGHALPFQPTAMCAVQCGA